MKIVYVNQDPGIQPGSRKGAAVHVQAIRQAFARLGHQVFPVDCPDDKLLAEKLTDLHAMHGVDVVYERHALGAAAAASFCKSHKLPHIIEVNAPLAQEAKRWRNYVETAADIQGDAFSFAQAKLVVCVTDEVAEYTLSRGADVSRVMVVANGYDPEVFYPRNRGLLKDELGLDPQAVVIGFHGRLRPWHRFDCLVESVAELLRRGAAVQLLAIGEGPYQPLLKVLPEQTYRHIPWVDNHELGNLVAAFDLLPLMYDPVQPCYFSPLKLNEGKACGVVPVVPSVPGLQQFVTDDVDGVVYPTQQLTETLQVLCADPGRRQRLGAAAIASSRQHTWLAVAHRTLDQAGLTA